MKKRGITIIHIIISSDKTQLTVFRNKTAYPVYITIGNLPKHIRRKPSRQGQVLLAYLPTSKLSHIVNKSARRRALANLFHACMKFILRPLEKAVAFSCGVEMVLSVIVILFLLPMLVTTLNKYLLLASKQANAQCVLQNTTS